MSKFKIKASDFLEWLYPDGSSSEARRFKSDAVAKLKETGVFHLDVKTLFEEAGYISPSIIEDDLVIDEQYPSDCELIDDVTKIDYQKEFDKYFERVEPKKMITFLDLYRKGMLYAFDLRDGSDFLLTDENEENILSLINSPDFIFGTQKPKEEEKKGNDIYFLFGKDACKVFEEDGVNSFIEAIEGDSAPEFDIWRHNYNEFSVIDFANASVGWNEFSIITKMEYDLIFKK